MTVKRVNWYAVLPCVVGLFIFACVFTTAKLFSFDALRFPMPDLLIADLTEPSARIAWAASACALATSCLFLMSYSTLVFRQNCTGVSSRLARYVLPIVLFAVAIAAFVPLVANVSGGLTESLFRPVAELSDGPPVLAIIKGLGSMASIAGICLMFALSSTLVASRSVTHEIDIARKMKQANYLLYLSALFLVSGIAQMVMLFRWPSNFVSDPVLRQGIVDNASALSLAAGFFYTFSLMVVFVPVGILHEAWRDDVGRGLAAGDPAFNRTQWERNAGLDRSALSTLVSVAAVGAPLVAGAVLGRLMGG